MIATSRFGGSRRAVVIRALVASITMSTFLVGCEPHPTTEGGRSPLLIDDFESGAISEWQAVGSGAGGWFVYSDGQQAPDPTLSDPNAPFDIPDPPQGTYAVVTDMDGAGTRIIYRDLRLEGRATLHLTVFYEGIPQFASPDTLAHDGPDANQQFRIDLLDPSAPIDSVASGDVLVNVFHTWPGDPAVLQPIEVSVDVSPWAGRTVRLRLAQTDNQGPLRAGVDGIWLVPLGDDPDARVELLDTQPPTSAIDLVLGPMSEHEVLSALSARAEELSTADEFSGAVLLAKDGQILFGQAYGSADRERGTPNTLRTRFRIGSMNKMFTAVAILQLVEAGEVDLTATLDEYLPDYPNERVAEKVTIHHLLTHTGGTGDIFGPEFDAHRQELRTLGDYVELFGRRGFDFLPGNRWAYSNYGFILLGAVIEAVTGQSYYDYVREHIFDPAGMTSTGSLPEDRKVSRRSIGYTKALGSIRWEANTDTLPYRGTSAGGGYSTVEDLARFADALLSRELLSRGYTELLITSKVGSGPGAGYAYGFEDRRDAEGNGSVGHGGGAPGMNGDLRIYPRSGYVVVVLANLDPPAAQLISDWLDAHLPTEG